MGLAYAPIFFFPIYQYIFGMLQITVSCCGANIVEMTIIIIIMHLHAIFFCLKKDSSFIYETLFIVIYAKLIT
jgi:hypothetical protein